MSRKNIHRFSLFAIVLALTGFILPEKEPQTVVFLGDSITNRGMRSGGYIDLIKQELTKKNKARKYILIGAGHEGNTVPDLQARVERDVIAKKPNLVFIYIGINDVWKSINNPPDHTPIDKYETGLREIITKIKASGAKVILCTPSVIGEKVKGSNPQDVMLDQYSLISRKVAYESNIKLCDLRSVFVSYLSKHNPENSEKGILTHDGVHLNDEGNRLVAKQIMKYLK
jgi:lysophospholipase L1-like esterase